MIAIPPDIQAILDALRAHGYEACPVGGCVRDSLRGETPGDWDICTSALPEAVIACFPAERTIPTGLKHGTVTVRSGAFAAEVTTYRTEGSYSDLRRPDSVSFVRSLEEDLQRRDFTINAMALNAQGEIVDLFGGQADLTAHLIRCVGEPEQRFREDSLRILRALRFASKLDFEIEAHTLEAARRNRSELSVLSAERVWKELGGILLGPGCSRVLKQSSEVLALLLPELGASVIEHRGAAVSAAPADLALRLSLLFCGLDSVKADSILRRLRCDTGTRMRTLRLLDALTVRLTTVREQRLAFAQKLGWADTMLIVKLREEADADAWEMLWAETPELNVRDLALGGTDLIRLGFGTGKVIGETLQRLLLAVWRMEASNTRESLLQLAGGFLRDASEDCSAAGASERC